jgi:putative transferase (TIGR04331 family)
MKANFLVSAHPGARIPGARELFVTDPYVRHALEVSGELARYESVTVAPPSRATREAFERDHDFVDARHRRYVPILAERLNEVHGMRRTPAFWQKALSLALLRHVTFCYDLFQACEAHLRPAEHDCRILAEGSFFVPDDFNSHRRFFQHTDYGQEQLFGVYCRLFHPGAFAEWTGRHAWPAVSHSSTVATRGGTWKARLHPKRVLRRALRMRAPTLGIVNSYFSQDNVERLLVESRGRIQTIALPRAQPGKAPLDWSKRERLCRAEASFDRFDRFVFAALRHGMPRAFVEDTPSLLEGLERFFAAYPKLRWVVSEAWIGDMHTAFALAVLVERGVRHIYNEHNYLAHPFFGNNLKYIMPLVDECATLGWQSENTKIVPGASLFPWVDGPRRHDADGLLYISGLPQVRAPEINASYGEAGAVNAPRYLDFVRRFFAGLSDSTLREITFRGYPARHAGTMQAYDLRRWLDAPLKKIAAVDDMAPSARSLMRRARLVVVDYLSTAYLEAMMLDVPTVFFWNPDAYYLEAGHREFFARLASVGVCQTDPLEAASFVERIRPDPERWWRSAPVREARSAFLGENMGEPRALVDHLLRRSREGAGPLMLASCP